MLVTTFLSAQNQDIYNLEQQLALSNDSLEKVHLYFELASNLKNISVEKALDYNRKALRLANKIQSDEACASINELMGELFDKTNNIQPAINYYLISANIYERLNDLKKLSSIYGNLGMLYSNNNYNTERALFYYRKSLDYAVKLNEKIPIAQAYNRIGGVFFNQRNLGEAKYYFLEALKIFEEVNYESGIAKALNNIGEVCRIEDDLTTAISYYMESLEYNIKQKNFKLMAVNLENIGLIYSLNNDPEKAFEYYNKSLENYTMINDVEGLSELYIRIADEYMKINDIDGAHQSYQKAYNNAFENDQWQEIKQAALGLSTVFEKKRRYKTSLSYLRIYAQYNDSIIKKQMSDELFDLKTHFLGSIKEKEIQIRDSDIEILENEREIAVLKQNLLIAIGIILLGLTATAIIRLRFRVKKQKLINIKDRQLHETQQELLKVELSSKDNDLISFALHIVQKNQILKQIKTDLNKLSSTTDKDLNKKIKELSLHVQQSLQITQEVEEFQKKVDVTYGDFFYSLKKKHPELTNNEKRLCALLRLNLTTKEIATLNNTSVKAVEMSRYRLRKKCNLENKDSLHEYLFSI